MIKVDPRCPKTPLLYDRPEYFQFGFSSFQGKHPHLEFNKTFFFAPDICVKAMQVVLNIFKKLTLSVFKKYFCNCNWKDTTRGSNISAFLRWLTPEIYLKIY